MPEPVALAVITAIVALLGEAWNVSKMVYEQFNGIRNAPKHISAIAQDIRGLSAVLGSLRGLLLDLSGRRLHTALVPILENLKEPLDNCFSILCDLQKKINKYTKPSGEANHSKWAAFFWQFTEKDTAIYRSYLDSYKLTINIALTTANFASSNIFPRRSIEAQMQAMKEQLDNMSEQKADVMEPSLDTDVPQGTDHHFALNKFLKTMETAETIFSGSPPESPSFSWNQISSSSCSFPLSIFPKEEVKITPDDPMHSPSHSDVQILFSSQYQTNPFPQKRKNESNFTIFDPDTSEPPDSRHLPAAPTVRNKDRGFSIEMTENPRLLFTDSQENEPAPKKIRYHLVDPGRRGVIEPLGDRNNNSVAPRLADRQSVRGLREYKTSSASTDLFNNNLSAEKHCLENSRRGSPPFHHNPLQKRTARSREKLMQERRYRNSPQLFENISLRKPLPDLPGMTDQFPGESQSSPPRKIASWVSDETPRLRRRSATWEPVYLHRPGRKARVEKSQHESRSRSTRTKTPVTKPETSKTVDDWILDLNLLDLSGDEEVSKEHKDELARMMMEDSPFSLVNEQPNLPYPSLSKEHAMEAISRIQIPIFPEVSVLENGFQYMPAPDQHPGS